MQQHVDYALHKKGITWKDLMKLCDSGLHHRVMVKVALALDLQDTNVQA